MSRNNQGVIHGASQGGVVGQHPPPPPLQSLVGPATGTEANTIQIPPVPILCWKVEDVRFAFDSSFVSYNTDPLTNPSDPTSDPLAKPFDYGDIRDELKLLASQIQQNPGCPLSLFGHADPVGPPADPDGYNKALSGRRATSIYALLISCTQPDKAVSLWQAIAIDPNEHWGTSQAQVMQQATGLPDGTSVSDLIPKYIPTLIPPEFKALQIGPANFLAQGADPQGKGDYQGCSSFNPLIVFSQSKEDSFAPGANDQDPVVYAARNLANAPNRRVMALIFTKGSKVDPNKWPCPSASATKPGCIKRFWSDGDSRRHTRLPDTDRKFEDTHDTFACRFYQRISDGSPCHPTILLLRLRLFDRQARPLPKAPFIVTYSGRTISGFTDQNGDALVRDVELPTTCVARWSRASPLLDSPANPPDATWRDFEFEHTVSVGLDAPDTVSTFADLKLPPGADAQRLWNMGYIFQNTEAANVRVFQQDAGLGASGSLTDASPRIREQHDVVVAPPPPSLEDGSSWGGGGTAVG